MPTPGAQQETERRQRLMAGLKAAAFALVLAPALTRPMAFLPAWLPPSLPRLALVLLGTVVATRLERRSLASAGLSLDLDWWKDLASGATVAIFAATAILAVLMLFGGRWVAGQPFLPAFWQIGAFASIAAFEEIAFRGFLFFRTKEAIGTTAAVVLNAGVFAFAHGLHGGLQAVLMPALSLALASGIVAGFTAATGRTGAAIGLHFGWNLALGAVFGCSIAGHTVASFFVPTLKGSSWITGGAFGPAASIPGLLFLSLTVPVLRWALQRNQNQVSPSEDTKE